SSLRRRSCRICSLSEFQVYQLFYYHQRKRFQIDNNIEMPELCPEWLALLIIEKACLSSISLYETSGVVCKTGRNFKEKLRELGGLDAVFEITLKCQSDLKKYLEKTAKVEDSYLSTKDVRNDKQLKSLTLLLKCLKIMENVTFLSEDNQAHFLGLKWNLIPQATLFSFVELILTIIKFLSEMFHFYWIKDSRHRHTTSFTYCQMTCPYGINILKPHGKIGGKVWCYPNVATSFIETLEANELLMVLVGQMYYSGYGVPKDDQKSREQATERALDCTFYHCIIKIRDGREHDH
ncbi:hypothetical protein S83_004546, partial [Arachis hypogaea]